jgi:hypothetical protein
MICISHSILFGYKIRNYEMCGSCSRLEDRKGYSGVWGGLEEKNHLEDLSVDGRKILK